MIFSETPLAKAIDKLSDKFDNNKPITLNEAKFILWAEMHIQSYDYLEFGAFIESNNLGDNKFIWDIWHGLFLGFQQSKSNNEKISS